MKLDTLLWLLPLVFMLHDFEEIILMQRWLARSAPDLQRRFPALAARLLPHLAGLSTAAFALAVAEEFVLLCLATYLCVEFELYAVWAGLLLAFGLHLIAHVVQFGVWGRYVPAIVTSVPAGGYCVYALWSLNTRVPLAWPAVALWTAMGVIAVVVNLGLAHALAARFEHWLKN